MAFLEFKNVKIAGISAGVPKTIADNLHPTADDAISTEYSPDDFVKTTGVKERRVGFELTTSDLCYAAAEKLIADLGWDNYYYIKRQPNHLRLGAVRFARPFDNPCGRDGFFKGDRLGTCE